MRGAHVVGWRRAPGGEQMTNTELAILSWIVLAIIVLVAVLVSRLPKLDRALTKVHDALRKASGPLADGLFALYGLGIVLAVALVIILLLVAAIRWVLG
jgi:hypothetical protein